MAGWDLWEAHDSSLRPLLPGFSLTDGREQLWVRRDAHHPWQLDVLLDRSDDEWIFKRDASNRLSTSTLDQLGYAEWARLARQGATTR